MNKNDISWGIIGCGNVTEVKSGPAFQKVPRSKLTAVMRRNRAKAADYAQRHRVPKFYDDAEALIRDPEVNAIYVATPPSSHLDYTIKALEAGKPVYVEKPMAMNATEAEAMLEASRRTGVKLSVAHYRRQQPIFLKLKEWIDQQIIGQVQWIELKMIQPAQTDLIAKTEENWRLNPAVSGGGLFHDLAPHQLDLMLYFFGRPQQVQGLSASQMGPVTDTVSAQMRWKDGKLFTGFWSFAAPGGQKEDSLVITGSRGRISCAIFANEPLVLNNTSFAFEPLQHVQQPMIEEVAKYFRGEAGNPCPAEEGLQIMQMIDTIVNG